MLCDKMTTNLTCTQVSALLSFYLNDRLNEQLKQFVCAHLEICPICRAKFEALKEMVESLKEAHAKISVSSSTKTSENSAIQRDFRMNLSAYIDNELSDEENIKIKKYIISNPNARKELENLYTFRKHIQNSFEKTKQESRNDFSKSIMKRLDFPEEVYCANSLAKAVALFLIIFAVLSISALIVFWI